MEPIDVLRERVDQSSQTAVADELEVSKQMVSAMLKGQRRISDRIAARLGLEKIVLYRRSSPTVVRAAR